MLLSILLAVWLITDLLKAQDKVEELNISTAEQDQEISPLESEPEKKLSPLAQEALSRRIEELIAERMENCRLKAIKDAEVIIDSLIIQEALEQRHLEETFPEKPIKPELPDTTLKGDSLKIKPLFED